METTEGYYMYMYYTAMGVARFSCLGDGGMAYNERVNYSWNWLGPTGKCY